MRKSKAPRSLAAPCNLHMICVMFDLSLPKSIMKVSDTEKRLELVVNVTCDMPCHSQMEVAPLRSSKKMPRISQMFGPIAHPPLPEIGSIPFDPPIQGLLNILKKSDSAYYQWG